MFKHLRTMPCLVAPTIVSSDRAAIKESTSTLENLQTAFNGESNANARDLAFAKKAGEEGFGELASLFRGAAKAEEIHARNHSDVIRKMGATPALNLEPIEAKLTHEDLKTANADERYERDLTYSEFVEVATHEKAVGCDSGIYVRTEGRSRSRGALPGCIGQPSEADRIRITPTMYARTVAIRSRRVNIVKCLVCGNWKSGFIAVS